MSDDSDWEPPMNAWVNVVCCSLFGAVVAGGFGFFGLFIFLTTAEPTKSYDIRVWQFFAATIGGLGSALCGLVVGLMFGIAHAGHGQSADDTPVPNRKS
jgi:branched-subunit amino acid ABC-type transport system permease component